MRLSDYQLPVSTNYNEADCVRQMTLITFFVLVFFLISVLTVCEKIGMGV